MVGAVQTTVPPLDPTTLGMIDVKHFMNSVIGPSYVRTYDFLACEQHRLRSACSSTKSFKFSL